MNEKNADLKNDSLGDEYLLEEEKKRRRKHIAVIATVFVFGSLLLFFDVILNFFTTEKPKSVAQIDKEGARISRITEAQWQTQAVRIKELLGKGKVDEALNILLAILSKNPEIAEANYLAGTAFLRQGKVQGAYDQFKRAATLKPDYYEAQEKLGEIYLLAGDYQAARDISSSLAKKGESLQGGLLLDAEIAEAEGDLDEAMRKAGLALEGGASSVRTRSSTYLADLLLKKGDKRRADKIIDTLNPADLDAAGLLSLAKYHLGAENEAKAQVIFLQALSRYPESAEVNYSYAQYLFKKRRFKEASQHYKRALISMPNAQIIAYHLTHSYMASGQMENAKVQLDQMLRSNPDSILSLGLKFHYHVLSGNRDQAIEALKRITVLLPSAPRPYTILAMLYRQEGKTPLVESNAVKALKRGEKTVLPHLLIGEVFFNRKKYEQALSYYNRVLEVQPANVLALLQAGDAYLSLGQPQKAEMAYAKALKADPRTGSIQMKIAWAKAQGGDLDGALAMDRRYLNENPGSTQALSAYANTLVAANRLDEALNVVQNAVKKDPKEWSFHYLLGDLLTLKKDFKNAVSCYDAALELNPTDVNMALHIGSRYEKNAQNSETEKYYLKILKKIPNNRLVVNQLAWFYIENAGMPAKAKELIESLIPEREWPEMRDTIAWYYYHTGKYVEAENYFREALRMTPDRNEIRARLALTLYSLNKKQEAASEAQKVIAFLGDSKLKNNLQNAMSRSK